MKIKSLFSFSDKYKEIKALRNMMFPNELSYERYSLLNERQKRIYDYEHPRNQGVRMDINEQQSVDIEQPQPISEQQVEDAAKEVCRQMMRLNEEIGDDFLRELVGDEYESLMMEYSRSIVAKYMVLNETPGWDMTWWSDLGWLGKFALGGLAALLTLLYGLLQKGLDKYAKEKLKKYMNKLVELTDDGINKKRPWYSFFIKSKNYGEQNRTCLRTIKESFERKMNDAVILNAKACGMFPSDGDGMSLMQTRIPVADSGLGIFKSRVLDNINLKIGK